MTKNSTNININTEFMINSILSEDEMQGEMGEAFSSLMLNPFVTWAKFILTDDKPNGNKQRIPQEEFANLIRSGIHMPIKMAKERINDGHEDSFPIGVITHLKEDGNRIIALAALWSKERPKDVEMLKQRFDEGSQINISWEIQYAESDLESGGVQVLKGTELTAATIVGMPAYAGRTPMIAFAAKKWSKPYVESLPDSSFLYVQPDKPKDASGNTLNEFRHFPVLDKEGNLEVVRLAEAVEEVDKSPFADSTKDYIKSQIAKLKEMHQSGASLNDIHEYLGIELQESESSTSNAEEINNTMEDKIKELEAKISELESKLAETVKAKEAAESALAEKSEALAAKDATLAELQAFKEGVEGEKAKAEKMAAIKQKFADSHIERDEEYFNSNAEFLLDMPEKNLDFMLQEMVSFAEGSGDGSSAASQHRVPNLPSNGAGLSVSEMVTALRERKTK